MLPLTKLLNNSSRQAAGSAFQLHQCTDSVTVAMETTELVDNKRD